MVVSIGDSVRDEADRPVIARLVEQRLLGQADLFGACDNAIAPGVRGQSK